MPTPFVPRRDILRERKGRAGNRDRSLQQFDVMKSIALHTRCLEGGGSNPAVPVVVARGFARLFELRSG